MTCHVLLPVRLVALAMASIIAVSLADKCHAGLISGQYEFKVPYSAVCLYGTYPMSVGNMTTGCSLAANVDASGNITGGLDLRTLKVPITGTLVSANGKMTLQLQTSQQNPPPLQAQFKGDLQGNQFVGTATRYDGTVPFTVDISAMAPLEVTFAVQIAVDQQGQVTGTGTASSCNVTVPVTVTGSNTSNSCALHITGVNLPNFVWNGSGEPSYTGFTATYTAYGFGVSASGSGVIVAPKATAPALLANISGRLPAQINDNVLIGGFIVTGKQPKTVIIRAIGPSLSVPGKLLDPQLELHDASGAIIRKNDNWKDAANKQAIIDSTIPPADDRESAILVSLAPGAYTAIVNGVNNTTGIALVEVYDLDRTVDSKLANISTRGLVQTGDNVLIGGFIVLGTDPQKVVVRVIGPSLPLPDKLIDPILELYDPNGDVLAINDDWVSNRAEVVATNLSPASDKESVIIGTLIPGGYTAIVRGVNGATGVAVVEVYGLNP
jgi:hypothetical protein